jgi:hypothetical protein
MDTQYLKSLTILQILDIRAEWMTVGKSFEIEISLESYITHENQESLDVWLMRAIDTSNMVIAQYGWVHMNTQKSLKLVTNNYNHIYVVDA